MPYFHQTFPHRLTTEKHLLNLWLAIWLFGVLLQMCTEFGSSGRPGGAGPRAAVDINDPSGGQNDLLRRLLLNEDLSRDEMFESRFPMLSGMGNSNLSADNAENGGNVNEAFREVINSRPLASASGGMVERARAAGVELTEAQFKILEICETDEEERNRILFGGGLW